MGTKDSAVLVKHPLPVPAHPEKCSISPPALSPPPAVPLPVLFHIPSSTLPPLPLPEDSNLPVLWAYHKGIDGLFVKRTSGSMLHPSGRA